MNLTDTRPAHDVPAGDATARPRLGAGRHGSLLPRGRRSRGTPVAAANGLEQELIAHSRTVAAGAPRHATVRAVAGNLLPDGPDGPWPVCLGLQDDGHLHAGPLTLHRLQELLGTPFVVQDPPPDGDAGADRAAAVVLVIPAGPDELAGDGHDPFRRRPAGGPRRNGSWRIVNNSRAHLAGRPASRRMTTCVSPFGTTRAARQPEVARRTSRTTAPPSPLRRPDGQTRHRGRTSSARGRCACGGAPIPLLRSAAGAQTRSGAGR